MKLKNLATGEEKDDGNGGAIENIMGHDRMAKSDVDRVAEEP